MREDLDTRKTWIKKPKAFSVLLVTGIVLLFWIVIARALIPQSLSALMDGGSYPVAPISKDMDGSPDKRVHAEMLYREAVAHLLGRGVPKDIPKSIRLYREAADAGHPQAQEDLALIYYTGYQTRQDFLGASKLYHRAALQGQRESAYNLGLMYCRGEGVPKDDSEGAKWIRTAADAGSAEAQWSLGLKYGRGEGVPRDSEAAMMWIKKAADQGFSSAVDAVKPEKRDFLDFVLQYRSVASSSMKVTTD